MTSNTSIPSLTLYQLSICAQHFGTMKMCRGSSRSEYVLKLSLVQQNLLNSFMPNGISIVINWTSPFPFQGLLGGIFHVYSNFKRNFCLQTMENLIRRRVLRRLIRFCTACRCPTKRTLGLYGLSKVNFIRQVVDLQQILSDSLCACYLGHCI